MSTCHDVAIVGGGIQGAGVAQAAAAAGYRAVLLERAAVGTATSSKSSKLIHGGLRYLESGQFALVHQSLRERAVLLRIAPELVQLVPFYIPVYRHTTRRPWQVRAGLSLYALLGGLASANRFCTIAPSHWDEADGLLRESLQVVYRYMDGQTDDAALTRAVMYSATQLGAELACPANFVDASYADGLFTVRYDFDGQMQELCSRTLVNAAGAWVSEVGARIRPAVEQPAFDLVQGTHIVLDRAAPHGIYYVEAPQDPRAVFIMPWQGRTMVGTTETVFNGDPAAVSPMPGEIDYLLEVWRHYFPGCDAEVVDSFAGLRVLPRGGAVFHRARDTVVRQTSQLPALVSLYGGKLTGYRATAQKVMQVLSRQLPVRAPVADTARLILRAAVDTL
ncbi:MAG: FAD-dependent oxidoreductase [Pseudomonadota bacterium]|nr:MAG: FAD-dependent oxidoreductase [Pseudomonadota bacterium]